MGIFNDQPESGTTAVQKNPKKEQSSKIKAGKLL